LDEEVIRQNLLKRTLRVFHQVIKEAFAKPPMVKEGGAEAKECDTDTKEDGSA